MLIKCPECEKEISDKSLLCVYCGYPISAELKGDADDADEDSSLNSVPITMPRQDVTSKRKFKYIIGVIVAIIAVVIIIICVIKGGGSKEENGLYNGLAWGTSYDDLISQLLVNYNDEELINDDGITMWDAEDSDNCLSISDDDKNVMEIIYDYSGNENLDAMIIYYCENNDTLDNIIIFFSYDDSDYTCDELYQEYTELYSELFGEGDEGDSMTAWETSQSKITVVNYYDETVMIQYEDIDTVDND